MRRNVFVFGLRLLLALGGMGGTAGVSLILVTYIPPIALFLPNLIFK